MSRLLQLLFVVSLALVTQLANAQEKTYSGVVKGEDDLPLPGVTILQKGTQKGTTTDFEGNFEIKVPEGAVLKFSSMGYEDEEVEVKDQQNLDIIMKQESKMLEEFQVIGYGSKKRRDVVGSVSQVSSEDINSISSSNFTEGLQGSASGVRISQNDGMPGSAPSVQIRGLNSITLESDPLWIIDGVPVDGGDAMNMLNPNDIESVNVLKDAKATAIYGSRGSAGVVIVTTKTGKAGEEANTTISIKQGIQTMGKNYKNMGYANTDDFFQISDQARTNSGLSEFQPHDVTKFFTEAPDRNDTIVTISREAALSTNTDWFDEVLRTGRYQDFNLSTNGGFEKGSYYVSANYQDIKGVLAGNDYKKLSTRMNTNYEMFDNFRVGSKINLGYFDNNQVRGGTGWGGSFGAANQNALPWFPVYNSAHPTGYWNPMSGNNLVANSDRDLIDDRKQRYRAMGNVNMEYDIPWVDGLKISSDVGVDLNQSNQINWLSEYMNEKGSRATDNSNLRTSVNYNLYMNYNRGFGAENEDGRKEHNVDVTLGTESQMNDGWSRKIEARKLTTNYHEVGDKPAEEYRDVYSYLDKGYFRRLRSYFTRADYQFKGRYLLGLSYRTDGSSRFLGDNKWGSFTAYSFGWIISDEPFFNYPLFKTLKLRGSFGQTGNESVGSSVFYNQYNVGTGNIYGSRDYISAGSNLTNAGNPEITWETTNSFDVGIDYDLFDNRVSGSFAYYEQKITDLLLSTQLPPSAAVGHYWDNVGNFKNWGWEFNVSSVNMDKPLSKFKWSSDFNIATTQNEVTKLTGVDGEYKSKSSYNAPTRSYVGNSLWSYFMAEYAGVHEKYGVDMIYEIDQQKWENDNIIEKTGRKIPATKTNVENNRILHDKTANPTYHGGLTNKMKYRNWDFNFRITFAGGHHIYDYNEQRSTYVGDGTRVLKADLLEDTWQKPGDDAEHPQLVWNYNYPDYWDEDADPDGDGHAEGDWHPDSHDETAQSDNYNNISAFTTKFLYRGDYLRLKSLEVGYNLPSSTSGRLGLKNVRVYFNATNVLTWAYFFPGWDPESGPMALPPVRTFNFGANITF